MQQTAIIIGAGPAGLTAAYELLTRTEIKPVVIEASDDVGGISRTVNVNGNRIDIGGHRFFSKSDTVMEWWLNVLPLEPVRKDEEGLLNGLAGPVAPAGPEVADDVMLVRSRVSRILYGGKLFRYPLSLSVDTLAKLGWLKTLRFGLSYLHARLAPIRPERNLEDFMVNRFGRALYHQFFREYTEKVWGASCQQISAEWGAQRIKGLSISRALAHAIRKRLPHAVDLAQQSTETSLIERFLYPKYGPGHLWQRVADQIREAGGEIRLQHEVIQLEHEAGRVTAVQVRNCATGTLERLVGDQVISTMPVRDLIAGMVPAVPAEVARVAEGLVYRDFMTAALLLDRIELSGGATGTELADKAPDNWIYIQEPGVKVGRLQIFNNWSPYMTANPDRVLVGLEYFANIGDPLWTLSDEAFLDLAVDEMESLGLIRREAVLNRFAVRMPKAYPAYLGTYRDFHHVRSYLDGFSNLFLVGRNGMHRYNNQDHSMLTAMAAVEAIRTGRTDKAAIWAINTEQDYHEAKRRLAPAGEGPSRPAPPKWRKRSVEPVRAERIPVKVH